MKKLLCLLVLLIPVVCFGQENEWGLGAVIGSPVSLDAKYWIDSNNALDIGFSVLSKNDVYAHASYLLHDYSIFPKPEEGKLPFYYGVGVTFYSSDIGVRSAAGISYLFEDYPFDLFMEIAPLITVYPDFNIAFTGGIGGRYYWGGAKGK